MKNFNILDVFKHRTVHGDPFLTKEEFEKRKKAQTQITDDSTKAAQRFIVKETVRYRADNKMASMNSTNNVHPKILAIQSLLWVNTNAIPPVDLFLEQVGMVKYEIAKMEHINFYEELVHIFSNGINDAEGEARIYDENKAFITANMTKLELCRFKIEDGLANYLSEIEISNKTGHEKEFTVNAFNSFLNGVNLMFEVIMNDFLSFS